MSVSTDKIIPGVLPPKEECTDTDLMLILDSFDPASLSEEQLEQFAVRNSMVTGIGKKQERYFADGKCYVVPPLQIDERLYYGRLSAEHSRAFLEEKIERWNEGRPNGYKNARQALISAIGCKVCYYYVRRENDLMTDADRAREHEAWVRWVNYCRTSEANEEIMSQITPPEGYYVKMSRWNDVETVPVMSEKLKMLRKALGLNQRIFAKKIGYNVNKYPLLEQGKLEELGFAGIADAFPLELIRRVVDLTYCNPYWLENNEDYTLYDVFPEETAMRVSEAMERPDGDAMFADVKVIRYWWSHHE